MLRHLEIKFLSLHTLFHHDHLSKVITLDNERGCVPAILHHSRKNSFLVSITNFLLVHMEITSLPISVAQNHL